MGKRRKMGGEMEIKLSKEERALLVLSFYIHVREDLTYSKNEWFKVRNSCQGCQIVPKEPKGVRCF